MVRIRFDMRKKNNDISGLTMIELIVALSMAVTLVATVYYFWNFLNKHTHVHTQNAIFTTEVSRIANSIGNQIRNASSILSFDASSITFVTQKNDTIKYEFNGDSLLQNETPLTIISKGANVTDFTITNLTESDYREAQHALFEIALTMTTTAGDSSSISLTVRTPKPVDNYSNW